MKTKLAFVIVLLLGGCQTPNVPDDFSFEPSADKNTGIIIGSVTQNNDVSNATVADFRIDHQLKKDTKLLYSMNTNELLGGFANKFGFEEGNLGGRMFVVEVEEGDHQLDYWSINHNNNYLIIYPKVPPPKLEFSLEHGQIMYIGNFHIDIVAEKNFLGALLPLGGEPSINNKYPRDIELIYEKYPQLKDKEITINVLHEGTWINEIHEEEELEIPTSKEQS